MASSLRRRVALLLVLFALLGVSALASQTEQPPRAAQDEFVPIDQLPPDESLPAARLLIAAYAVAWLLVAGYLWSIWQRLGRVEREIAEVARRVQQGGADASRPVAGGGGGSR